MKEEHYILYLLFYKKGFIQIPHLNHEVTECFTLIWKKSYVIRKQWHNLTNTLNISLI